MHESLTAHLGRTPSPDELAQAMGISRAELQRIEADLHQSVVLRIDHLATDAGADAILPSTSETPESVLVERERQSYLRDAVHSLPERLQKVVRGCFFEDRPMRELAEELGVTESRISQLRAEALKMLRDGMNSQLAPEMLPEKTTGVAANRREAYYATIASRSSFHARLGLPDLTARPGWRSGPPDACPFSRRLLPRSDAVDADRTPASVVPGQRERPRGDGPSGRQKNPEEFLRWPRWLPMRALSAPEGDDKGSPRTDSS